MNEAYVTLEMRSGSIIFGITMAVTHAVASYEFFKKHLDPESVKTLSLVILTPGDAEDWTSREYEINNEGGRDVERRYNRDGTLVRIYPQN